MQISPIAQVALLQTEMNSGFRFVPRIGMNSATGCLKKKKEKKIMYSELSLEVLCYLRVCEMMMGELPIQGLT